MRAHFCFSRFWSRYSLSLVRPRPCSPGGYGRISIGHFGDSHLLPLRNSFIFSRRQRLQSAPVYLAMSQTLRRLGGRQPLWGTGVTSLIVPTSRPTACSERIAVSRPEPGPFTKTSTLRMPCSWARRAAASAAICAANGVDLREPLNPTCPAEAQLITLPVGSVIDTIVLLKVLLMCAAPWATFFFSLRRTFLVPAAARALGGISLRSESVFVAWVVLVRSRRAARVRCRAQAHRRSGPLGPATVRRHAWISGPSSCPRWSCAGPCSSAVSSWCAARARGARGGAAVPGSNRSPPCGGCRRPPHGAGHPRRGSARRCSRAA